MLITPTKAFTSEDSKFKELPLEARHSICLEIAKKKRLKVPTSIFIPKELSRKLRFLRMPQRQESSSADLVVSTKLSKESIRRKLLSSTSSSKKPKSNLSNISINSLKSNNNNSKSNNNQNDKITMLHPESFPILRQTVTSEKIRCVVEKLRDRNEEIDLTRTATAAPPPLVGVAVDCIERAPACIDMPNLEQICYNEEPANNCLSFRNDDDSNYGPTIETTCIQCEPCQNDDEEISFYGQQQYQQYNGNRNDCIKTENYYDDGCVDDGNVDGDNGRVGCLQPCGSADSADGAESYGYLEQMINKSFKDDCNCMPMTENINDIMMKNTQEPVNYNVNAAEQNYYAEYTREKNNEQLPNNCMPTAMPPLCVSPPTPLCPPPTRLCTPTPPLCSPPAPPAPPPQIQTISDYLSFAMQQQQREAVLSNCAARQQQQQQQQQQREAAIAAQQQREAIINCAAQQQRQALINCATAQPCQPITPQPKDSINFLSFPPPFPPLPKCNDDELRRAPIYSVPNPNRFPNNFNNNCNPLLPRMPGDQNINNNNNQTQQAPSLAPPPQPPPPSFPFRFPSTSSTPGSSMPIPYYTLQQQQQEEQRHQQLLMSTLSKPQIHIIHELKQQHLQQQQLLQLQQLQQQQQQSPSEPRNYSMSFERPCWHAREAARTRMPASTSMYNAAAYGPCSPCAARRAQRFNCYQGSQQLSHQQLQQLSHQQQQQLSHQQQQQQQQLREPCDIHGSFLDTIAGPFKSEQFAPASTRQQPHIYQQQQQQYKQQQHQQQQGMHPGGHCCSNHLMHSNNSLNGIGMCQSDMQFGQQFPYYSFYSDYRNSPYATYNPYASPNMQTFSSMPAYNVDSNMWHPYHLPPQASENFFKEPHP